MKETGGERKSKLKLPKLIEPCRHRRPPGCSCAIYTTGFVTAAEECAACGVDCRSLEVMVITGGWEQSEHAHVLHVQMGSEHLRRLLVEDGADPALGRLVHAVQPPLFPRAACGLRFLRLFHANSVLRQHVVHKR